MRIIKFVEIMQKLDEYKIENSFTLENMPAFNLISSMPVAFQTGYCIDLHKIRQVS